MNLKPIVPGHVLVIPTRHVARLADLTTPELTSLMSSVQQVGQVIEKAYNADALTIACQVILPAQSGSQRLISFQDGKAAGQSIPHVHFHLLPRKLHGDKFSDHNDAVYPALEHAEGGLPHDLKTSHQSLEVDADADRKPRAMEEMEKEANWLKTLFSEPSCL